MRACFAIALDSQMKHGSVKAKVFSWTILWKWKLMLKVSYRTSLQIRLIQRMIQWKISTAYTVITAYKVAKSKRRPTYIVSTKNLSQHFECLVKMRATSSTLFVRVNAGVTKNAVMKNARPKSNTGKPETDTHYRIQCLTQTLWGMLPVPRSLKLSIRHFAINVVMLYSLK